MNLTHEHFSCTPVHIVIAIVMHPDCVDISMPELLA